MSNEISNLIIAIVSSDDKGIVTSKSFAGSPEFVRNQLDEKVFNFELVSDDWAEIMSCANEVEVKFPLGENGEPIEIIVYDNVTEFTAQMDLDN